MKKKKNYLQLSINHCLYEISTYTIEYDRIDISEGIDVNKNISTSKQCYLCSYWYFIDKNFNYQKYMCNGCHDMSMKAISMYNLCIG